MSSSLSLLPLTPQQSAVGMKAVTKELAVQGYSEEEAFLKISDEFDTWLEPTGSAKNAPAWLESFLGGAAWTAPASKSRAGCYAALVQKLAENFRMSRRHSAIALSPLPLMLVLARDFRASPAKIASIVSPNETRLKISWKMIDSILREFGIKCELNGPEVQSLLEKDRKESLLEFGDATAQSMVESLVAEAQALGLSLDFQHAFRPLFAVDGRNKSAYYPYLQALLYMAVIDRFFDHPPEFIYTFRPRGEVANAIFSTFPPALTPGGNPLLNNFKAVDRLASDWAESRDELRDEARALVEIVQGLSSLAHASRSQMCDSIRRAIIRYIEIQTPAEVHVAGQTDIESIKRFLGRVCNCETGTRGVIEQRVVDFFGAFGHPSPEWKSRGLGDPVNASNSSSSKLGDCDFQNIKEQKCVAFEAHAGRLTDVYVREHLRTLRLNLPARIDEWTRISDADGWKLQVIFFVHEDGCKANKPQFPDRIESLEIINFQEYFESLQTRLQANAARAIEMFNQWVVTPLDAPNTPLSTKVKANELLET